MDKLAKCDQVFAHEFAQSSESSYTSFALLYTIFVARKTWPTDDVESITRDAG